MKNDLATTVIVAIVGVVAAYFICDMLVPPIESVKFKTIDGSVSPDVGAPNSEIFNYKALNPTVEVYVGTCTSFNQNGECINDSSEEIDEGVIVEDDQNQGSADERGTSNGTSD